MTNVELPQDSKQGQQKEKPEQNQIQKININPIKPQGNIKEEVEKMFQKSEIRLNSLKFPIHDQNTKKRMEQFLQMQDKYPVTATAALLRTMRRTGLEFDHPETIDFFKKNLKEIVKVSFQEPKLHKKLLKVIEYGYYDKNTAMRRELIQNLLNEVVLQLGEKTDNDKGKAEFISSFSDMLNMCKINENFQTSFDKFPYTMFDDLRKITYKNLGEESDFLQRFGIDAQQFRRYIDSRYSNEGVLSMIAVLGLEYQQPGVCQRLQQNFGINSFYKFPQNFLLDLGENGKKTTSNRRVLEVVAADDYNGVLTEKRRYKKLLQLRKYGIEPLLFEISSLKDLQKLLEQTNEATLKNIFQVIFSAHGSFDSITLGLSSKITKEDMPLLSAIFKKMPNVTHVILDSCSTAKERKAGVHIESIARIIRDALGITIEAPKTDVNSFNRIGKEGVKYRPSRLGISFGPFGAMLRTRFKADKGLGS